MKTSEIAKKYGIDAVKFDVFLDGSQLKHSGILNYSVDDDLVEDYVMRFKEYQQKKEAEARLTKEQKLEALKAKKAQEAEKAAEMSKMLISSGFSFEGYRIIKYSGYISGDDAVEIPRGGIFGGNNGENLTNALVKIRRQALKELKQAAYDLGCNAIIGVDFDYLTLEPESVNIAGGTRYEPYVICVTANGNAVIIEKDDAFPES